MFKLNRTFYVSEKSSFSLHQPFSREFLLNNSHIMFKDIEELLHEIRNKLMKLGDNKN